MEKEDQAQIIIDKLWQMRGDKRITGRTVYEAARMLGAKQELAMLVSRLWEGPDPLN